MCGIITYTSKMVRGGRTFSRCLITKLKGLAEGNPRIRLYRSEVFLLDIEWWLGFSHVFNGKSIHRLDGLDKVVSMSTDASLTGYGPIGKAVSLTGKRYQN